MPNSAVRHKWLGGSAYLVPYHTSFLSDLDTMPYLWTPTEIWLSDHPCCRAELQNDVTTDGTASYIV